MKYEAPKKSPAAVAVGVKGEFVVAVKINKDGKVISANLEKVHPLLRRVLEEAVDKWLFSTDKNLEEREVKITFEYRIKSNNFKRNTDKPPKEDSHFKKPFRLVVTRIFYPISY